MCLSSPIASAPIEQSNRPTVSVHVAPETATAPSEEGTEIATWVKPVGRVPRLRTTTVQVPNSPALIAWGPVMATAPSYRAGGGTTSISSNRVVGDCQLE